MALILYRRNCFPVYVLPYSQSLGTTLKLVSVLPSLELSSNDRGCPLMSQLMCHTWPQLRPIESHPNSVPLIFTDVTSPAPPTLLIRTVKKKCRPLTENLTPPSRRHLTLQTSKETCQCKLSLTLVAIALFLTCYYTALVSCIV